MSEKEGHARTHTRLRPFDVDKAQSIGNANPKHMLVASYFKTFSLLLVGGGGVTAAATTAVVVLFSLCFFMLGAHIHHHRRRCLLFLPKRQGKHVEAMAQTTLCFYYTFFGVT